MKTDVGLVRVPFERFFEKSQPVHGFLSGDPFVRSRLWTEDPEDTLDLPVSEPTIIIFESGEKIYPNPQTCMVFLTFYGNYDDENNTPYGQTIPFEALTVK